MSSSRVYTYAENLAMANQVMEELKQMVKGRNEIIPITDLPIINPTKYSEYKATFGEDKFTKLLQYIVTIDSLREKAHEFAGPNPHEPDITISRIFTLQIATALCGLGECGEQTHLAVVKLMEKGYVGPVSLLELKGNYRITSDDHHEAYTHMLLVLGDIQTYAEDVTKSFESLSEHFVFLDPLHGITGKANEYPQMLKPYLSSLGLNKITNPVYVFYKEREAEKFSKIMEEANKINLKIINACASEIKERLKQLTGLDWKYSFKDKVAHIIIKDSALLERVESYLKSNNQINVRRSSVKYTNEPILICSIANLAMLNSFTAPMVQQEQIGVAARSSMSGKVSK